MVLPLLKLQNISKSFGAIQALDNVDLNLYPGKVMALVGENGAGKSTIVKCIAGVYSPSKGKIFLNDKKVIFKDVNQSIASGISVVYQELKLVNDLTVAENIFLNREPKKKLGIINWKQLNLDAQSIIDDIDAKFKPTDLVKNLSLGSKQMVEIAKALSLNSKIILFDEPTDALSQKDTKELFKIIKKLKKKKVAILYISHRLEELKEIADDISVFRDGHLIWEKPFIKVSQNQIVEAMIGRKLKNYFPKKITTKTKKILEIKNLDGNGIENFSFDAYSGEILGISGLMGSGRTEAAEMIIGAKKIKSGSIKINGKKTIFASPAAALKAGISYLSEDRKEKGVFLNWTIEDNITISALNKISNKLMLNKLKSYQQASYYSKQLNVKASNVKVSVNNLSGGNQQKVSLAKSLFSDPQILIIDEPTRGIDIGSKREIYDILFNLKQKGVCIIILTSDLPELLGISDRIIVAASGKTVAELDPTKHTQNDVMKHAIK